MNIKQFIGYLLYTLMFLFVRWTSGFEFAVFVGLALILATKKDEE